MRASLLAFTALAFAAAAASPAAIAQKTCDDYFTKSQSLGPLLTKAYTAMSPKNLEALKALLPELESALSALPAQEVKAEVCGGNHINAYTMHQNAELNFQRARGADIGFANNLPIVKQPDLNHAGVAYTTGWIKYELKDFAGALAAFEKGLVMFPHDVGLQTEKLATLVELQRYADVVAYSDKVISESYTMNDENRAKVWQARAVGLIGANNNKGADEALTVSLRYYDTPDAHKLQKQVRETLGTPN